jgi:hypothetical protein
MARDLERHGTLRRRTATAMWATYVAHSALTIRALYRPARPLPVPVMPAKLAGLTLTGAGLGLCVAGMRRFSGTHELTGTRNQPLTTTGIYRHSLGRVNDLGQSLGRFERSGRCCDLVIGEYFGGGAIAQ